MHTNNLIEMISNTVQLSIEEIGSCTTYFEPLAVRSLQTTNL
jgi:hypothetical protein